MHHWLAKVYKEFTNGVCKNSRTPDAGVQGLGMAQESSATQA